MTTIDRSEFKKIAIKFADYIDRHNDIEFIDAKCDFIEEFFECLVYWYNETEKEKRYAEYLKLKEEFESGINQSN